MMGSRFALIDGNAFYASCEKVFRPDLEHQPIVVLSNNDGCIVTLTSEAKSLGLERGTPLFKVRDIVENHGVKVFSSNYERYASFSTRMMKTIASLVPAIEVYSIDECFADVEGIREGRALGLAIKKRVKQWVGIPTCVGLGRTKTEAKLANHLAKKNPMFEGVLDLGAMSDEARSLWWAKTPLKAVWQIGPQNAARLASLGIVSILDFVELTPSMLNRYADAGLKKAYWELKGEVCYPLDTSPKPPQHICRSRSFGTPVTTLEGLESALAYHVDNAMRRARRSGLWARRITVFVATNRFKEGYYTNESSCQVAATQDTCWVTRQARDQLRALFVPGLAYKKVGVILGDFALSPVALGSVGSLFDEESNDEKRLPSRDGLMQTMDEIVRVFGPQACRVGLHLLSEAWHMRRAFLSANPTTQFSDVLQVH